MHQSKPIISDIERKLSVVSNRVERQQRIIDRLREGPERIEARSLYADLLRDQLELEEYRAKLTRRFSGYKVSGTASAP
jgi:Na+/phosphate symporter